MVAPNTAIDVTYGAVSPPSEMCPELNTCPELGALTCNHHAQAHCSTCCEKYKISSLNHIIITISYLHLSSLIMLLFNCLLHENHSARTDDTCLV